MTLRDIICTFIGFAVTMLMVAICIGVEWTTESNRVYVRAHYRCNDKVIDMPIDMTLARCEYDITPSNSTVTCHFVPRETTDASR